MSLRLFEMIQEEYGRQKLSAKTQDADEASNGATASERKIGERSAG